MMPTPTPRYDRAPSEELLALLRPEGFLSPLVDLTERKVSGLELDVHLRRDDEIHVYCGLTRVLTVKKYRGGGLLDIRAHPTYTSQPCAQGLFRWWRTNEQGFTGALERYLSGVEVDPASTAGEGAVQLQWSRVREPWVPFDREAALAYESTAHRERTKSLSEVEDARAELIHMAYQDRAAHGKSWEKPSPLKKRNELDQLAVDPQGRLVLIELKDGSSKSLGSVFYAPFQLLQCVWEWCAALGAVQTDLQRLIKARVALGLMPKGTPRLTGGIRAVVGFGRGAHSGAACSDEVKRRYCKVLSVVNEHLPPGVGPIETWEIADTGPRRLYSTKAE